MHIYYAVLFKFFGRNKLKLQSYDLSPEEYDMKAVNDRTFSAMMRVGKTRADVAELFGMDSSIPLALQPKDKVPRPTMGNIVRLAEFLGVSVGWLLTGKPENEVDVFVISVPGVSGANTGSVGSSASSGAAIIAGASNSTVIVQNIAMDDLSAMEREVIQAIRNLPARDQAAVMSYVFAMDCEHVENNQPPGA